MRDFGDFASSDAGEAFFSGAWGWWAMIVVLGIFNTVLGEELLFRGLLLPRMRRAFGKWDWAVNAVLFAVYHVHQPWTIPSNIVSGAIIAYPSRRFQSAWMGIIIHSAQSLFVTIALLTLVLS